MRFEIKPEHLKLIRRMNVRWQDCEYGAPEIDPKRPYGNSDVEFDILKILEWQHGPQGEWEIPEALSDSLRKLHEETETALQICLCTGTFEEGLYEAPDYHYDRWKKVGAA